MIAISSSRTTRSSNSSGPSCSTPAKANEVIILTIVTSIITTCAFWYFWSNRPKNHKQKQLQDNYHEEDQIQTVVVSPRGMKLSQSSPLPYLAAYFKAISNPCHHITNRNGFIALCVAENKLVTSHLIHKLTSSNCDYAKIAFGKEVNYYYNDTRGLEDVRDSVAKFITKRFIQPLSSCNRNMNGCHATCAKSQQIVLGSGAAAILNFLFHCIANENDIILIPAPYYAAFEHDMSSIGKVYYYF